MTPSPAVPLSREIVKLLRRVYNHLHQLEPYCSGHHAVSKQTIALADDVDALADSLAAFSLTDSGAPSKITDAQCIAAMREFSAQKGESHDALWDQLDEQTKATEVGEWRAILECALLAGPARSSSEAWKDDEKVKQIRRGAYERVMAVSLPRTSSWVEVAEVLSNIHDELCAAVAEAVRG